MSPRVATLAALLLLVSLATRSGAQEAGPVVVEPADLTRRADLVGREVKVDDRVSRFQFRPETRAFDEIYLRRAPDVPLKLGEGLRYAQSPQAPTVSVVGVLRREGDRWWVQVKKVDLLPADIDRLNRAVATAPRTDSETRTVWARWAERRAKSFQPVDAELLRRAREVETDAIRAEAERPPRDRPPAEHWLALANRARERELAEPEPSALAHKGFRAAIGAAAKADDLKGLAARVATMLPASQTPAAPADEAAAARWERPYANDPAEAYRNAPDDARRALDRRLWADTYQKWVERQSAETPGSDLSLAEEAARKLPDRPKVAEGLLDRGLTHASKNVAALRQDEVDALARSYRDKLGQPEKARELYRAWLNDQRDKRLSPQDAEGRVALAQQYERLLDDRPAAVALLRDAWRIDPESREVADAFRRRGFRKVNGEWTEPPAGVAAASRPAEEKDPDRPAPPDRDREPIAAPAPPGDADSDSLLNATPEQVRARMGGRPNRRSWTVSQGQVTEQWVYQLPGGDSQVVTFLKKPGDPRARVVSRYALRKGRLGAP